MSCEAQKEEKIAITQHSLAPLKKVLPVLCLPCKRKDNKTRPSIEYVDSPYLLKNHPILLYR